MRADEENAWTRAQNAELDVSQGTTPDGVIWEHDAEQNWFITDWKRTGNPTYEDTAVSAFSIPYLYKRTIREYGIELHHDASR